MRRDGLGQGSSVYIFKSPRHGPSVRSSHIGVRSANAAAGSGAWPIKDGVVRFALARWRLKRMAAFRLKT